ncbi:MAG: TonB family protein [Candidatus Omnitrophica bacterium]|nr:TonB family protein [Candidatus Omnitrophota bacterium]
MAKRTFKILTAGLLGLALFLFIHPISECSSDVELVKMIVGETRIFPTRSPSRVVIGNPAVADVTDANNSEITVNAKGPGTTTFAYKDVYGEQSFQIRVYSVDIFKTKERIDNLLKKLNLPEVYTQAEEEEGKVFLLGRVKTADERERVFTAIGPLKDRIVDLMQVKEEESVVEIDVQILELNKDATKTLGMTWPGSITFTEVGSPGIAAVGTGWDTVWNVLNVKRDAFSVTLDLLIQEGKARVLSRPRLACQSGKEAEMLVGGEKPIMTTSVAATTGATGTNVDYKEFGIKLNIKPVVTRGDRIKLQVKVEVSDIGTAETLGSASSPTARAYPLIKRNASTELFIDDGKTLSIGGLIRQKTTEDLRRFPWLSDIPVLGAFFRKRTTTEGGGTGEKGDTELFITITPKVIAREVPFEQNDKKEIKAAAPLVVSSVPEEIQGFASIVQKRIVENLAYPASAKKAGFQGTTKLSLHLTYGGQLVEAKLKESSGYKILDDNAMRVAAGVSSYPPFPSTIPEADIWIDVPVVYQLD